MLRSNKQPVQKIQQIPKTFANPELKLANLKIPTTEQQQQQQQNPTNLAHKNKTQTQILLTKHTKRKKPKPIRLWVCNE